MKDFYLLHFLNRAVFGIFFACSVANFLAGGLSLSEACLCFFFFAMVTCALEIPLGLIADRLGRKVNVLLGSALVSNHVCKRHLIMTAGVPVRVGSSRRRNT